MGVEVLGYAVMSNHFHCILRSRHDVVATWSDAEIAQKWWMLCPARKNKDGSPAEPTEFELNSIRSDKKGLKEKQIMGPSVCCKQFGEHVHLDQRCWCLSSVGGREIGESHGTHESAGCVGGR